MHRNHSGRVRVGAAGRDRSGGDRNPGTLLSVTYGLKGVHRPGAAVAQEFLQRRRSSAVQSTLLACIRSPELLA